MGGRGMDVKMLYMSPPYAADLAARCCTSAEMPEMNDSTRALEAACLSGHLSILEHIHVAFSIEGISRACSHQLVRHRLMTVSQQSQRYVNMDGFAYATPESIRWADEGAMEEVFDTCMSQTSELYEAMTKLQDIPMEDARAVLPNACCTNMVVSMNLRECAHICQLRLCNRAQGEIGGVAACMSKLVKMALHHYGIYTLDKLFGPQCGALGYCPEKKTCGKEPTLKELRDAYEGAGNL